MGESGDVKKIINSLLKENGSLRVSEIRKKMGEEKYYRVERQVFNILKRLQDDNSIQSIGNGQYTCKHVRPAYVPHPSSLLSEVGDLLRDSFPLMEIQIWELAWMNEFVNHLIGNNVLFVETEKDMEEAVFQELFHDYRIVLLAPDTKTFYNYYTRDMIVVQRLITGAPSAINGIFASLEKLMVDLFSTKLTGSIISRGDYPEMFENIFNSYSINEAAMFRYAKRRGVDLKIKDFLSDQTGVRLMYREN